ncbi:MAG: YqgE/AlgH family protein [Gammaproteobacteria bacterium]|nr:YqgE/AlgH family protein [Gammaproteobacteria bacterium]
MDNSSYLSDHFLIAMPGLGDPNFHQSVTYICRHDEHGALGIVVNRPLGLTLADVFEQMSLEAKNSGLGTQIVLSGGPVQPECGFVVHERSEAFESSLNISDDLALTTSRDVLAAMAEGKGPGKALVALGYAGWDAGQLDRELAENAWLSVPRESDILFATPLEQRWTAAARLLGVDISQLSHPAGHA